MQNTVAIPTGAVLGHCVHARCLCVWFRLPDSAETVEVEQLQFIAGRRLPFRAAETALHGPALSEDQRDSSVAVCCLVVDAPVVHVVLDMPVVVQRQAGMAQIVQKTVWKYRRCSSCIVVDVPALVR